MEKISERNRRTRSRSEQHNGRRRRQAETVGNIALKSLEVPPDTREAVEQMPFAENFTALFQADGNLEDRYDAMKDARKAIGGQFSGPGQIGAMNKALHVLHELGITDMTIDVRGRVSDIFLTELGRAYTVRESGHWPVKPDDVVEKITPRTNFGG